MICGEHRVMWLTALFVIDISRFVALLYRQDSFAYGEVQDYTADVLKGGFPLFKVSAVVL
jgi:hypothetical protein